MENLMKGSISAHHAEQKDALAKVNAERDTIRIKKIALTKDMHDLVEDYEGKEEGIHELETQILKLEESIERTNTKIALEFAEKKEALEKELEQLNRKCEEKTDKAIAHERYALEPLQWDLQEREFLSTYLN